MTTTNTFTGRTARNAIENPPINKQDCFEAGFNEFEEEFIGGLERGEKELGSGGGPAVDSNAEMAMKVALEMTGAAGKSWSFRVAEGLGEVHLSACVAAPINVVTLVLEDHSLLCCIPII